jgi:hypothetical protein
MAPETADLTRELEFWAACRNAYFVASGSLRTVRAG